MSETLNIVANTSDAGFLKQSTPRGTLTRADTLLHWPERFGPLGAWSDGAWVSERGRILGEDDRGWERDVYLAAAARVRDADAVRLWTTDGADGRFVECVVLGGMHPEGSVQRAHLPQVKGFLGERRPETLALAWSPVEREDVQGYRTVWQAMQAHDPAALTAAWQSPLTARPRSVLRDHLRQLPTRAGLSEHQSDLLQALEAGPVKVIDWMRRLQCHLFSLRILVHPLQSEGLLQFTKTLDPVLTPMGAEVVQGKAALPKLAWSVGGLRVSSTEGPWLEDVLGD